MSETPATVKERLIAFLKAKHITNSALTRMLGVSPAYIGAMRKSLPEEKVKKLSELFPDLNRDWLLYGEGEMLIDAQEERRNALLSSHCVPLLPVDAFAGSLQMWSQSVKLSDCQEVVCPYRDVDYAIRISGDSMEPEFRAGMIVFIKKIRERSFIPWGYPLIVDTENGVLLKNLYPVEENSDVLEARSNNPDYPPFLIPTDSIYGLYRVVGSLAHYTTI